MNFCSQCGNKITAGGKFCSACGAQLNADVPRAAPPPPREQAAATYQPVTPPRASNLAHEPVAAPPQVMYAEAPPVSIFDSEPAAFAWGQASSSPSPSMGSGTAGFPTFQPSASGEIALWNPRAVFWWALPFSLMFGGVVIGKNWEALGQEERKKSSFVWAAGALILFLLLMVITPLVSPALSNGLNFTFLGMWGGWWSVDVKLQLNFIKEHYPDGYQKKSLTKPVLLGAAAMLLMSILSFFYIAIASNDADLLGALSVSRDAQSSSKPKPNNSIQSASAPSLPKLANAAQVSAASSLPWTPRGNQEYKNLIRCMVFISAVKANPESAKYEDMWKTIWDNAAARLGAVSDAQGIILENVEEDLKKFSRSSSEAYTVYSADPTGGTYFQRDLDYCKKLRIVHAE